MPSSFAGILVGERRGRHLLFRGAVEWGLGLRTAKAFFAQSRFCTSRWRTPNLWRAGCEIRCIAGSL